MRWGPDRGEPENVRDREPRGVRERGSQLSSRMVNTFWFAMPGESADEDYNTSRSTTGDNTLCQVARTG